MKHNIYLNGKLLKTKTSPITNGFLTLFQEPVTVSKDDIMTSEMEFHNTQLGVPYEKTELPEGTEPLRSRPIEPRPIPRRIDTPRNVSHDV